MLESNIKSFYKKHSKERFCQGDILRDVKVSIDIPIEWQQSEGNTTDYDLPYCVIMTQDCDLDRDFESKKGEKLTNNDKHLPTILVCPAYRDLPFYEGKHLVGWKMQEYKGKALEKIQKNDEINRCHFLKGDSTLQIPNLVIDFKHFYTLPTSILYEQYNDIYLATINELFRERLSQRFANYLSRFGLPELKS
ncbi:MAG: hypothetical protein WA057_02295 [Candidatus Magasanikiibacteriota bacterium]